MRTAGFDVRPPIGDRSLMPRRVPMRPASRRMAGDQQVMAGYQ